MESIAEVNRGRDDKTDAGLLDDEITVTLPRSSTTLHKQNVVSADALHHVTGLDGRDATQLRAAPRSDVTYSMRDATYVTNWGLNDKKSIGHNMVLCISMFFNI